MQFVKGFLGANQLDPVVAVVKSRIFYLGKYVSRLSTIDAD